MPSCANHPDIVSGLAVCSTCGGSFCPSCIISLQGRTVCAGCKGGVVQDIKSNAVEGLELAGRGARFGAQFIDGLLMLLTVFPLLITIGLMSFTDPKINQGLLSQLVNNLLPVSLMCIYEALMLKSRGQTLGKMVFKIKVVQPDGSDLTTAHCWKRAGARSLLAITQIGGIIDILMIFAANRQTLHDRIAKTRVVAWKR